MVVSGRRRQVRVLKHHVEGDRNFFALRISRARCGRNGVRALVLDPVSLPRRIPPWRRRDADPGPIVIVLLVSLGVLVVVLLATYV